MKKLLWVVGTIVSGILWFVAIGFIGFGITIATTIITRSGEVVMHGKFWAAMVFIGWVILIILSIILWKRWNLKCQACKRWGALVLSQTELAEQENISVLMETERRDSQGYVVGHQDQYIPGKRKTYLHTYQCKHCGNLENRTQTKDTPSI